MPAQAPRGTLPAAVCARPRRGSCLASGGGSSLSMERDGHSRLPGHPQAQSLPKSCRAHSLFLAREAQEVLVSGDEKVPTGWRY